jgi:Fe-S-cluster-containing dehydrogenase component
MERGSNVLLNYVTGSLFCDAKTKEYCSQKCELCFARYEHSVTPALIVSSRGFASSFGTEETRLEKKRDPKQLMAFVPLSLISASNP